MSSVSVLASTISPQYLQDLIISKYGFEKGTTCGLLRTGMNHTYLVKSETNNYVLRLYSFNWRSKIEIHEELDLLLELSGLGIPVSFPIQNNYREYVNELIAPEGLRYFVLFSFAEGGKVRNLNVDTCAKIGDLVATIHNEFTDRNIQRADYGISTMIERSYAASKTFFDSSIDSMKSLQEINSLVAHKLKDADSSKLRKGIIHLDIWYDNMAITENDEITIFDFDFCGNGLLITDVAYFLKQLFHIESDKKKYEELKKGFLQGYLKKTPIASEELELIPYLGWSVFMFYLGIQTKRFDWSNIFLSENYLKMYVGRMVSWMAYHNIKV
ncbi:MAG: phosphotransferase [Flavobacteriaceae bacterium]